MDYIRFFNSVWKYIYSAEDYDDDEEDNELEDLIDKLQDDHVVPSKWLGEKVNFAFSKDYVDRHLKDFERVNELLNEGDWSLIKVEVDKNKVDVVYEDENQIAYKLKESLKHVNEDKDDYVEKFKTRTQQHIDRVNKYAKKIDRSYPNHDSDKFNELFDGYSLKLFLL